MTSNCHEENFATEKIYRQGRATTITVIDITESSRTSLFGLKLNARTGWISHSTKYDFFPFSFFFGETLTKLMFYEILRRPLYINLASNSSLISTLLHVVFF